MLSRQTAGGAHGPDGVLVSAVRTFNLREETIRGDEYHFTEEELARLRWIHANPPPDIDRLGPCPDWCKGRPVLDTRGRN